MLSEVIRASYAGFHDAFVTMYINRSCKSPGLEAVTTTVTSRLTCVDDSLEPNAAMRSTTVCRIFRFALNCRRNACSLSFSPAARSCCWSNSENANVVSVDKSWAKGATAGAGAGAGAVRAIGATGAAGAAGASMFCSPCARVLPTRFTGEAEPSPLVPVAVLNIIVSVNLGSPGHHQATRASGTCHTLCVAHPPHITPGHIPIAMQRPEPTRTK